MKRQDVEQEHKEHRSSEKAWHEEQQSRVSSHVAEQLALGRVDEQDGRDEGG